MHLSIEDNNMKNKTKKSTKQNNTGTCSMCKNNQLPPCKELENKYGLKKWCIILILSVIIVGLLGPFIAQCILSLCLNINQINGLEMWNQYVGIVLGVVATILSIVSLVMGFHSTNEAYEQQREAFARYQSTVELINRLDKHLLEIEKQGIGLSQQPAQVTPPNNNENPVSTTQIEF